jgi:hypothetical protein
MTISLKDTMAQLESLGNENVRAHDSLEDLTPWDYLAKHEPQQTLFMHASN